MLELISKGFQSAADVFHGRSTFSEANTTAALEEVRRALLEGDVAYDVVRDFLKDVRADCLGTTVQLKAGQGSRRVQVTVRDHFVQICQRRLEELLGPADPELALPKGRVAVVMMVGLQGSGKTTHTAKLARYLVTTEKRKPLLVAADTTRPAAVEQLRILGQRVQVPVFHRPETSPVEMCREALREASKLSCDTVILDTAGRITLDELLMQEVAAIKEATAPDQIFFVCDAMMGQDAVVTAAAFHRRLELSGIIMTKLDGDARGGAALSVKKVTGAVLKFLGTGEELDRFELFRPDGLASRILGLGDVVGLMNDFERVASADHEAQAQRALEGSFSFQDFYQQLETLEKMGPLREVVAKLPLQGMLPEGALERIDEGRLGRAKAMISSMTTAERLNPDLLGPSRIARVARGSGSRLSDVQKLVKEVKQMRQMFGALGGSGKLSKLMARIPGMGSLNQMRRFAQMARPEGGEDLAPAGPRREIDRDKVRQARKTAKMQRKKNRHR